MSTMTRKIKRRHNPAETRAQQAAKVVNATSAGHLHRKLVNDACTGHPTDLQFAILAYKKIALERRHTPEEAFKAVEA
ncbi:hypothetical protein OE165_27770, partial [Escherichia coli]|uniref:hypothetical protein n=1 Tax=Escherichia coli TaxID=562 RepID=UPI0021F3488C